MALRSNRLRFWKLNFSLFIFIVIVIVYNYSDPRAKHSANRLGDPQQSASLSRTETGGSVNPSFVAKADPLFLLSEDGCVFLQTTHLLTVSKARLRRSYLLGQMTTLRLLRVTTTNWHWFAWLADRERRQIPMISSIAERVCFLPWSP